MHSTKESVMKRGLVKVFCAAVALVFIASGVSVAQDLKIAFVDFNKFASISKKAQEQQKKFGEMVTAKRTALENKKKELDGLQEQLQKQGPMLKEETRNVKIKEIGIKEMELKLAEKEAQNQLQNEQREAQDIFRRDITKILNQMRADRNLSFILDSVALLSANDALDITEEVVRVYDGSAAAAAPKPKAPAPAAGPAKQPPAKAPK